MSNFGLDIVDNPALGLFFGAPDKESDNVARPKVIKLMLSPGQFNARNQASFVTRVCRYGQKNDVAVIGGTEAGTTPGNDTHVLLKRIAPRFGFHVTADPHGEWLLVNRSFGKVVDAHFIPVIPAQGHDEGPGAHTARGVVTNHIKPNDESLGDMFIGVSHYLTKGTDPNTERGRQNQELERAIGAWAKRVGNSDALVFHMGDTNLDDEHRNAYTGAPLISCWDELNKWPGTHGGPRGHTIDVIAKLQNKRAKCKSARALSDSDFPLPVDHYSVLAEYVVTPVDQNG